MAKVVPGFVSRATKFLIRSQQPCTTPHVRQWMPGAASVTAVVPGLYLVSCGFFSQLPFVATVRPTEREGGVGGEPSLLYLDRTETTSALLALLTQTQIPAGPRSGPCLPPGAVRPTTLTDVECLQIHLDGSAVCSFSSRQGGLSPSVRTENEAAAAVAAGGGAGAGAALGGGSLPGRGGGEAFEGRWRRRYSHPAGEVLATSTREYLALPAGALISVKFEVVSVGDGGSGRVSSAPGANVTGGVAGAAEEEGMGAGGSKGEEKSSAVVFRPQGFLEVRKL